MISSRVVNCSNTSSSFFERLLYELFLAFVSCSLIDVYFVAYMNVSLV